MATVDSPRERLSRPALLRAGDRVSVVAPGGPVPRERFESGVECIRRMGLEPVFEDGVLQRDGFLAGDDDRRAAELNAAIASKETTAIWAARGGYGATRLLPGLDLDAIHRACKQLIGFSDITALHAAWQHAGLTSIHGANVTSLPGWGSEAVEALRAGLFEGRWPALQGSGGTGSHAGQGILVGGNLAVLAAMVGTPHFPDMNGGVLLLEDVNEVPYKLDRMLTQLTQAGVLGGLRAIAVGHLSRCDDRSEGPDARRGLDVISEHAQRLALPVIWGLAVGHEPDSWAVPLGQAAIVDPRASRLSFRE